MRLILTIAILLASGMLGVAQSVRTDSVTQSVDSVIVNQMSQVDSARNSIERLMYDRQALPGFKKSRYDSILHGKVASLDSMKRRLINLRSGRSSKVNVDSVRKLLDKYKSRLKLNRFTNRSDSLQKSPLAKSGAVTGRLDSLRDSNPMGGVTSAVDEKQTELAGILDKQNATVNEKISSLSKESDGLGVVPDDLQNPVDVIPDAKLEKITSEVKVKGIDVTGKDLGNLPNVNTPIMDIPSVNTHTLPAENIDQGLSVDAGQIPGVEVDDPLSKLGLNVGGVEEIEEAADDVKQHAGDLNNIKMDSATLVRVENEVISKIPLDDELSKLQQQEKYFKEQQQQVKSYRNPEEYKRQTLVRSKQMLAKNLATHQAKLQQSVNKVSKYQRFSGTILSKTIDLPEKRDELKKLKPIERVVPGITFQLQKSDFWIADVNPSIRYRITSYWSAGAGWNERLILGDSREAKRQQRIYGPRAFTEVVIFKGLSMRFDAEHMNAYIYKTPSLDNGKRMGVWSYMAGIKKDFAFMKGINGNVQFMYNLYFTAPDHPYPTRLNVRFGFEKILRKDNKKNTKTVLPK